MLTFLKGDFREETGRTKTLTGKMEIPTAELKIMF